MIIVKQLHSIKTMNKSGNMVLRNTYLVTHYNCGDDISDEQSIDLRKSCKSEFVMKVDPSQTIELTMMKLTKIIGDEDILFFGKTGEELELNSTSKKRFEEINEATCSAEFEKIIKSLKELKL